MKAKELAKTARRHISNTAQWIAATILAMALWYNLAEFVVQILDFNLAGVKLVCGLLPGNFVAMAESAIRMRFHIDQILIVMEVRVAIWAVLKLAQMVFRKIRPVQQARPATAS